MLMNTVILITHYFKYIQVVYLLETSKNHPNHLGKCNAKKGTDLLPVSLYSNTDTIYV